MESEKNLLADGTFSKGFKLKGLNSIRDGHNPIKLFKRGDDTPDWFLCQWNSRYNLSNGEFTVTDDGYSISDKSKTLKVKNGGGLEFNLKASLEYDAPRGATDPWPHLLVEQEITENNQIKDLKKIECQAEFSLAEFKDCMGEAKKEHHTVQFVWVVTFKDNNPDSQSFGNFIWVVLCPFDLRFEYAPLFTKQDMALPDGEFIYSFCGKDFMDKPMKIGETVKINFDLYGKLPQILNCAQNNGFMKGSKLNDLVISSTNMGFEITGTFDCKVTVDNMKINIL